MAKRTRKIKTIDELDQDIARWQRRLRMAVGKIEKLQRQRRRGASALLAKPQPSPKPAQPETPKAAPVFPTKEVNEVRDIIERDTRGTDALLPKVDEDIPSFLIRSKPSAVDEEAAAKLKAEVEQRKEIRKKTNAAKRAESRARDAIPKSKRRWDTNKSQWTSD